MKKLIGIFLAVGLLSGCTATVPQEEYDQLLSEKEILVEERDQLVSERDSLQEDLTSQEERNEGLTKVYDQIASERDELKKQLEGLESDAEESEQSVAPAEKKETAVAANPTPSSASTLSAQLQSEAHGDNSTSNGSGGGVGNADNFNTYSDTKAPEGAVYVGNANTMLFHHPSCTHVKKIAPEHLVSIDSTSSAKLSGYLPCEVCMSVGTGRSSTAPSVSSSSVAESKTASSSPAERTVYWGDTGTKIHTNPNCRTLKGNVNSGTEQQAISAGHNEGYCKVC